MTLAYWTGDPDEPIGIEVDGTALSPDELLHAIVRVREQLAGIRAKVTGRWIPRNTLDAVDDAHAALARVRVTTAHLYSGRHRRRDVAQDGRDDEARWLAVILHGEREYQGRHVRPSWELA